MASGLNAKIAGMHPNVPDMLKTQNAIVHIAASGTLQTEIKGGLPNPDTAMPTPIRCGQKSAGNMLQIPRNIKKSHGNDVQPTLKKRGIMTASVIFETVKNG